MLDGMPEVALQWQGIKVSKVQTKLNCVRRATSQCRDYRSNVIELSTFGSRITRNNCDFICNCK